MSRHRFINDGRSPIPMGGAAEFACICGRRGSRAAVELHIAEAVAAESLARATMEAVQIDDDFDGGDTKAHYLPMEPREPATSAFGEDTPTPTELPPPPRGTEPSCQLCGEGVTMLDLPEIVAWSCGHWIQKRPRSIAESFQEMLRSAYKAGAAAAATGEPFETWYQREVLQ